VSGPRCGGLSAGEVRATGEWIASLQTPAGMIPWYPAGHADPWNHVEAAMALDVAGRRREAERAYEWLRAEQHPDGGWCHYYLQDGVEDPRRDPNAVAYLATGLWWHHLIWDDLALLEEMWPTLDAALGFVLGLQQPGGEVLWSLDADGVRGRYALLTSTSSIHHSLRCGVAVAECLGEERPEWELAAGWAAHAVDHRPEAFAAKDRWAMDWYYPVLCGAIRGDEGRRRLRSGWDRFVLDGVGVRCVSDRPWVTAAETSECVMALDAVGLDEQAASLADWTRHFRDDEGAYWTGCVHPDCVRFPGGERSSYTAAAVLLADHVLSGTSPASGLFRGETIPAILALEPSEGVGVPRREA